MDPVIRKNKTRNDFTHNMGHHILFRSIISNCYIKNDPHQGNFHKLDLDPIKILICKNIVVSIIDTPPECMEKSNMRTPQHHETMK